MTFEDSNRSRTLRHRAERLLAKSPETFDAADLKDIQQLAHELTIHQAELELQNEELRATQRELQSAKERFTALYEQAPVGYVVLDDSGIVRQSNATWRALINQPEASFRNVPFTRAIVDTDVPIFLSRFRTFFHNPAEKQIVVRMKRHDATPFHARIEATPGWTIPDERRRGRHHRPELMVVVSDISDLYATRRQLETRSSALQEAYGRLDHINRVLLGIRNVNQLITSEDDPVRLIQKACASLTENMGYFGAWIALLDGDGRPASFAASHIEGGAEPLATHIRSGTFPRCMQQALAKEGTTVVQNPETECGTCPLASRNQGRARLICRLHDGSRTYGVLSAAVPAAYAHDQQQQHLFSEVAADLALGLNRIETGRRLHRFNYILQTIPAPMSLVSGEYRYLAVNAAYTALFNVSAEEIVGRVASDFVGREVFEAKIKPNLDRCLAGEQVRYEIETRFPGRGMRTLEIYYYPYRSRQGEVTGVVAHGVDITDARRHEKKLDAIIESTPMGLCITDENGCFEHVNPAYCRLYQYTREELMGKHFTVIVPEESRAQLTDLHEAFLNGQKEMRGEWQVVDKFGRPLSIIADAVRIKNADGRFSKVTFVMDITEKKALEEMKADVDRIMRHDMKQPLNAILGFSQFLAMKGGLSEGQRDMLRLIEESGQRMLQMLDASLDIFKMETGEYTYHPREVDLIRVIRKSIAQNQSRMDAAGITCTVLFRGTPLNEAVLPVRSEEQLLLPLLSNLVINAVEASPEGGKMFIEVTEGDPVVVAVRNKGAVPREVRSHFFAKYKTHGKRSGTGLGTYSAKLSADTMGYGLEMETSDETDTTCVRIRIPGKAAPPPA